VIEALRTSILEPHDHLHINHDRMFVVGRGHAQIDQSPCTADGRLCLCTSCRANSCAPN
jgi:hypothetical protein